MVGSWWPAENWYGQRPSLAGNNHWIERRRHSGGLFGAIHGIRRSPLVWMVDRGSIAPAGEQFAADGINDAGSIVGSDQTGPVRWHKDTGFQRMLRTSAACTAPTAINDNGDVLSWTGNEVNGFGCTPIAWVIWRNTAQGETLEVLSCPDKRLCEEDLAESHRFPLDTALHAAGHFTPACHRSARARRRNGRCSPQERTSAIRRDHSEAACPSRRTQRLQYKRVRPQQATILRLSRHA